MDIWPLFEGKPSPKADEVKTHTPPAPVDRGSYKDHRTSLSQLVSYIVHRTSYISLGENGSGSLQTRWGATKWSCRKQWQWWQHPGLSCTSHVNLSNLSNLLQSSSQQCWCLVQVVQLEDEEEDPHQVNVVKQEECNLICKMFFVLIGELLRPLAWLFWCFFFVLFFAGAGAFLRVLGERALKETRQYQTSTGLSIRRFPFAWLVRELQQTQSRVAYSWQAANCQF